MVHHPRLILETLTVRSFCRRCAYRANTCASAAVQTFVGIDYVLTVLFADSANGTFCSASAASDAFAGNLVCHDEFLPNLFFLILSHIY